MHLHATPRKHPRSSPFRPDRPDARQYRHRLFRAGAGGHAERIVGGTWCHDPRCRTADHLRRGHAVHRFAAVGVADQSDRAPDPAHRDACGSRAHQRGLGICARLRQPADHPPGHAGGRRAVYAAGRGHRRSYRARRKARQHHRLYFSGMVARGRDRPAVDHLHRQPLRLARGLWQYRLDRLSQFRSAGVAPAGWIGRLPGGSQDLGRRSGATA